MYDEFEVGEPATLKATCINSSGALADPTALTLTVTDPSGNTDTHLIGALTQDSTGRYSYSQTLDEAGVWTYRFVASGNDVAFDVTEYLLCGVFTEPTGPCDLWIGPADVFALHPAKAIADGDKDYSLADLCAQAASRWLYRLSREAYPGICKHVVRPCRRGSTWLNWDEPSWWKWNTSWGNCSCGATSSRACGCPRLSEILLGAEPVLAITEVLIDGSALATSAYRLDDHRWLVRIDGDVWPTCQDLTADPSTDEDTFQVTFFAGRTPPADGILAAKRLAGDLYMGATGSDCAVPKNLVNRVRQGDTLSFADPTNELQAGLAGLREVDLFLTGDRWYDANRLAYTASPDMMPSVRRTSQ